MLPSLGFIQMVACSHPSIPCGFLSSPRPSDAYNISVVSCVLTVSSVAVGLACFYATRSPAMLGFGIENAVDLMSSLVVMWRFSAGEREKGGAARREKKASACIAMVMVALGLLVATVAIEHICNGGGGHKLELLISVSLPCGVIFGALGAVKYVMSVRMKSSSFKKDAVCSVCGSALSFGVVLGAWATEKDERLWWIDSAFAIFIGSACLALGVRTLRKKIFEGDDWR